jgi:hypothetical protein
MLTLLARPVISRIRCLNLNSEIERSMRSVS